MMYFKDCKNISELKECYKALCRKYHPDLSEDANATAKMQQINAEFTETFERLKRAGAESRAADEQQESGTTENAAEFMTVINQLVRCDGLIIDLIGRWVWVSGETYRHKDILKRLGFIWANKKKMWYWRDEKDACKSRKNTTIDEIKLKYGCKTYTTAATPRITATV